MSYQHLVSLYYQNKENYDKEYINRYNSLSTILFPVNIHNNQAFVVLYPQILNNIEKIYKTSSKIQLIFNSLPPIAKESFVNECLIEEIINTNGIEGVRSTRKEIEIAINDKHNNEIELKIKKFKGLTKKYLSILNNKDFNLFKCEDVLNLYKELVFPEIDEVNYPDGEIFRKESVSVYSETQKEIHSGITPESKIIEYMQSVINIINDDNLSYIIKVAVVQYLIGYIHPFYDGNGRLGRFIGSELISQSLSNLIAIRLSYIIKENITKYYKVFSECNDLKNKGDMTPFVIFMVNIISQSANEIYSNLKSNNDKLIYYNNKNTKMSKSYKNKEFESELMYIFIQNALFTSDSLDIATLVNETEKSANTIKKAIGHLMSLKVPIDITTKGNKKLYKLNLDNY